MFWPGGVQQIPYAQWTGELPGIAVGELVADRPVSIEGLQSDVVADEVVVGWSVSVDGLSSDVGWGVSAITTVDDFRDQTEYSKLPIL